MDRSVASAGLALLVLFSVAGRGFSAESAKTAIVGGVQPAGTVDVSLQNEIDAAIERGRDWIAAQQKDDGAWSNGDFPALTALALRSLIGSPRPEHEKATGKGVKFLLSCIQPDGGIYRKIPGRKGGGLSTYNTAICMTSLHRTGDRSLIGAVQNARTFIAGAQHIGGDVYNGGFGYDAGTNRKYTDILNTFYAVKAMKETQGVEDLRGAGSKRVSINWGETVKYLEKLQNTPDTGAENAGGFFYMPGQSKAGATTNESGTIVFRSYGSITYVGLLALIYADVSRDDTRVRSALDWSAKHWTLEENPGMGAQGLYFFYHVLTKALSTYGSDFVELKDGNLLNWRKSVALKLVGLQRIDPKTGHGYWSNESGRFWENDPVLVTAYCLLALSEM